MHGRTAHGETGCLHQIKAQSQVANPAFDITPAGLISALITERGVCPANGKDLRTMYPEDSND